MLNYLNTVHKIERRFMEMLDKVNIGGQNFESAGRTRFSCDAYPSFGQINTDHMMSAL